MKQRILQVMTAVLLIMTLTMANVLLLCADVVSYAANEINADKSTNHKNVEFMGYFKDKEGNKTTSLDTYTDNNDLKLYFQVSVKKEGYFNGNIVLNNANFKFKTDSLSDGISKIENNVIYLNQINAGESKELEVGIELIKDEQFDLNLINMESEISIEGVYRDSTQKDISIKSKKNVNLKLGLIIAVYGILGAIVGANVSMHLDMKSLRKYFGIFLLVVSVHEIYSIIKQYKKY